VISLEYDVHRWKASRYREDLRALRVPVHYRLTLPGEQAQALQKLMRQYRHENKNVTLRKMSEYMSIKDFFYKIETL